MWQPLLWLHIIACVMVGAAGRTNVVISRFPGRVQMVSTPTTMFRLSAAQADFQMLKQVVFGLFGAQMF
jgi:hypothetical protein